MVTVGSAATDWMNDGVFGDGWHLFGIGSAKYEKAAENYGDSDQIIDAFIAEYGTDEMKDTIDIGADEYNESAAKDALASLVAETPDNANVTYETEDEETLEVTEHPGATKADLKTAVDNYLDTDYKESFGAPDTSSYGVWVPGIPVLIGNGLDKAGAADWLSGLILDGIVAGVGAVLGFVPQMLVLFLLLAILEACGYMARIAFVLDRIFRKFGLSGKSFIPMLIGTGCGVPGIMASRTIENERDRRMTIMTTTFIPCGAKVPFIAMIAGAIFGGSAWVATSAYFVGMAAIIVSGIMLKKTKMFAGDPAPFVMELPAYHWPTLKTYSVQCGSAVGPSSKGRYNHSPFNNICLVHNLLRRSRRFVPYAFGGRNRQLDIGCYRQRDLLDIQASRLGRMAGCSCFYHRSCCKGKHRRYYGYSLRRRRQCICYSRKGVHRSQRLFVPCIQSSLRSLLRGNRCYQA